MPKQEQRQTAMLRTKCCPELSDVGDQPSEAGRAKVTQPAIRGASVPTMIDSVHKKTRRIQRRRKAVVAFTMLGESMGDLHHANGCAGNIGPGVRHDLGAVCVGDEGGG